MQRRKFLKTSLTLGLGSLLYRDMHAAIAGGDLKKLTILHTNDTHSRIDPFPQNDPKYPNQGGVLRRDSIIRKIRAEEKNVLLLDAGDIFQGTPYFNEFGGEVELKAMSFMGYDAATMGNHDFDNGIDGFSSVLKHAQFPFICSNYDFSNTPLNRKTIPYKIFKLDGLRIGVFGLGVELKGLVLPRHYGETQYRDPIKTAIQYSNILKQDYSCDYIICLSHLGYDYKENKVSDLVLAKSCKEIDLIIGGHTHTFLSEPTCIYHGEKQVMINQCGWAGIMLGTIQVFFDKSSKKTDLSAAPIVINKKNVLI